MKISSDWIVYYLRSFSLCDGVHNRKIGYAVEAVLADMGCAQMPKGKRISAPTQVSETGLAVRGFHYDIQPKDLPKFFKKLAEALEFDLE